MNREIEVMKKGNWNRRKKVDEEKRGKFYAFDAVCEGYTSTKY